MDRGESEWGAMAWPMEMTSHSCQSVQLGSEPSSKTPDKPGLVPPASGPYDVASTRGLNKQQHKFIKLPSLLGNIYDKQNTAVLTLIMLASISIKSLQMLLLHEILISKLQSSNLGFCHHACLGAGACPGLPPAEFKLNLDPCMTRVPAPTARRFVLLFSAARTSNMSFVPMLKDTST